MIQNNTTFNSDLRLDRDLIVKSGKTLTIKNGAKIYFADDKKLVVEPGAKLYINNATLTSGCQGMWEGIQVWGDENQHQWQYGTDLYYQGYVNLLDATIKDAKCALNLWNPSQWGTTGGIVIATNSHFINNTQSVHALNYKNYHPVTGLEMDYQAILKNCDFSLDKNYIGTYEFFKHIDLASVRGVKFYGCDFDLSREAPNVNMYNQAIAAYSAGFVATSYCTDNYVPCGNTDVCIFKNFHTGITVRNWDSPYTFYAKDCIFDNLVYGINNYAGNFSTMINNQFTVGSTNFEELCAFGINQRMATGFAIENNDFGFLTESICTDHYGIHTMNTNGVDEIYRNSFTDLKYANFASNKNYAGQYQVYGLSYICNQNDRNYADFYIQDNYLSMIQHNQGDRSFPAGNTFSRTGAIHLYNGNLGGFLAYHYNPLITAQSPDPLKVFGNVNLIQAIGDNPCNNHYGGTKEDVKLTGEEKLATEFEYADALYNFNSINELYTSLLDGGSTENKLLEVTTATENDAWILRNSLLGSSPHLTETVLKAMSERTDILSESTIFEILSANPDELRKEELIKYLEEKENPLPEYMIDILKQLALGNSYRSILEGEMARYDRNRVRAANDMIRCYMNESPVNYELIRDWLDNLGGLNADRQIISTYVVENNFTTAINLANLLPSLYEFSEEEFSNHNDYIFILTLQQNLYNEGRHLEELTSNEISMINSISLDNNDLAGAQASGIMEAYYGTYYGNCPDPTDILLNKSVLIDQAQLAKAYGIELIVNPNPANQWAAFDYKMPTNESSGEIVIFDSKSNQINKMIVNGAQGQVTLDTHSFKSGAYFYQFKTGLVILSGKIIVIH